MRHIVTDAVAWSVSVGRSVHHNCEPCKNGWTDRDAIWVVDSGGPKEPRIGWVSRSPMQKGNFEGEEQPIVKYRTLCCELRKNDWTDWDAVWAVDTGGPKEACIRSGCTLAPAGEYEWTNCPCAAAMRP